MKLRDFAVKISFSIFTLILEGKMDFYTEYGKTLCVSTHTNYTVRRKKILSRDKLLTSVSVIEGSELRKDVDVFQKRCCTEKSVNWIFAIFFLEKCLVVSMSISRELIGILLSEAKL